MLSRARYRGWENKTEQNWNPHLWNWVIVSAVTDNVEEKKRGLCHLWAAMWYGWIGSLLIQDLHFTARVASSKPSPVRLHVVNSSQKIPTHSFFLQDQFNSYLFFVFITPSILWVSKVIVCLYSDSICHWMAGTMPVFHLCNLSVSQMKGMI